MKHLKRNELLQVRKDLEELKEIFRTSPSYVSYGFYHILNKKDIFQNSPLFGWRITPSAQMNTRGPSMRFYSGAEGDISIRLNPDILFLDTENRGYIFLSNRVNREAIERYGNSLRSFAWGSKEREDYKEKITEEYCREMLIVIQRTLSEVYSALGDMQPPRYVDSSTKSLF